MFGRKKYPELLSLLFIFWLGLMGLSAIIFYWQIVVTEQNIFLSQAMFTDSHLKLAIRQVRSQILKRVATPDIVKGVYVTAITAGNNQRMDYFIDLIDRTELNSIVIDIKADNGWVAYNTDDDLINELGTEKIIIKDLPGLLAKLHEYNIYTIARISVFQDSALVSIRPNWAVGDSVTGGAWADWKGVKWLDAYNQEVWGYSLALAKDAIAKGFDEVNFDYIRFPSDGPMGRVVYQNQDNQSKVEALNSYFAYLRNGLDKTKAKLSVDLFGMTLWHDFDFNIGQTIAGAAPWFDYISPMIYPSHYPEGFKGFANPAQYPYEMTLANLEVGLPRVSGKRATLRPWLQDFNLGAVYDAQMVRAQIMATEERASTTGWLLWNASNRYTESALLPVQ